LNDVIDTQVGTPPLVGSSALVHSVSYVVPLLRARLGVEDVRSYDPPAPDAPPETQLFLLARRT
jgi:hypothetical protein